MTLVDFLRQLADSWGLVVIVWCVAIYLCFARRRENPKASIYLGLAILTRVLSLAVPYLSVLLIQALDAPSLLRSPYLRGANTGIRIVANAAIWILIAMAVFARPTHDDFNSGPMAEGESLNS